MRAVFSMVLVLALAVGADAWAMQNIKCIPADRARVAQWQDQAEPVVGALKKAKEGLAEGGVSKTTVTKLQELGSFSKELREKVETPELKEALGKVADELLGGAKGLAEADREHAAKTLDSLIQTLEENTKRG